MLFFYLETIVLHLANLFILHRGWKVEYLVTMFAQEMSMKGNVSIIADIPFINSQHLCSPVFDKQLQSIVHRCFRKGRDVIAQSQINLFDRGVRAMCQQIIHDSQALHGWFDIKT